MSKWLLPFTDGDWISWQVRYHLINNLYCLILMSAISVRGITDFIWKEALTRNFPQLSSLLPREPYLLNFRIKSSNLLVCSVKSNHGLFHSNPFSNSGVTHDQDTVSTIDRQTKLRKITCFGLTSIIESPLNF